MIEDDTISVEGLDKILKALKSKPPVARVGILGSSSRAGKSGVTNAEVGAAHEFGTTKLPQRSFLRIPIQEHLQKEMDSSGLLDEERLKQVIKEGSVKPWLKEVAQLAEEIVQGAFDSNGFGRWPAWKGNYTSETGQILVNTRQLRNSISSEVK